MIKTIYGIEENNHKQLFEQMFELRADQFKRRRKWSVKVTNGQERDYFDELNPLYVMVVTQERDLLASVRLLPTTGPHMLADIFPELMGNEDIIRHPLIWESSRFCINPNLCESQFKDGTNQVTRTLLKGTFEVAQQAGMHQIVSVADLMVEKILKRSGCSVERIGQLYHYDGLATVAGLCDVSPETIYNICEGIEYDWQSTVPS